VIGCGIALSVASMKTKTIEGRFYTYDKRSRAKGLVVLVLGIAISLVGFYIWGRFLRYGDYDLYVPG
jgi:hypothetical protein